MSICDEYKNDVKGGKVFHLVHLGVGDMNSDNVMLDRLVKNPVGSQLIEVLINSLFWNRCRKSAGHRLH